MLSAIPGGSKETWMQWRKTWQDMKKNVKSKALAEKRYAAETGGGPLKVIKFDDTANKILTILSEKATFGDTLVPIPNESFNFDQGSSNANNEAPLIETLHSPINFENETVHGNEEFITLITEKEPEVSETPRNLHPKRNRLVKSKRLEHTLEVSKQLLKIEEEKKKEMTKFYEEKKSYIIWRKEYEEEKLKYLKAFLQIQENILKEVREIKDYLIIG